MASLVDELLPTSASLCWDAGLRFTLRCLTWSLESEESGRRPLGFYVGTCYRPYIHRPSRPLPRSLSRSTPQTREGHGTGKVLNPMTLDQNMIIPIKCKKVLIFWKFYGKERNPYFLAFVLEKCPLRLPWQDCLIKAMEYQVFWEAIFAPK